MGKSIRSGHPYLKAPDTSKPKPDLLVHQPGGGRYNHAVIEIKSVVGQDIRKDLKTLSLFRNQLGYERAILLIYGATPEALTKRVQRYAANVVQLAPIEVWLHAEPTARAVLSHTLASSR